MGFRTQYCPPMVQNPDAMHHKCALGDNPQEHGLTLEN
jgi:hypothetical protein